MKKARKTISGSPGRLTWRVTLLLDPRRLYSVEALLDANGRMGAGRRRRPGRVVLREKMQAEKLAQLVIAVPINEQSEGFPLITVGAIGTEQVLQRVLDLIGGNLA